MSEHPKEELKKILIIDDEHDICMLLKRFLTKKGFSVSAEQTAEAGLRAVEQFEPDLVLSDFRLGSMTGGEVLRAIKDTRPKVPVIIMTGYSDIKIAVEVMKHGAFDYLTKPLFPDEILLTVQKALAAACEEEKEQSETVTLAAKKSRKKKATREAYTFGESAVSQNLVKQIVLVASTNYSVIIYGESGAGKEAVAREIHARSKRADQPFVAMDCGAIPAQLAGSELFGHEKGAFTGALEQKVGHFELADGGTLFLDEVANLSYEVQVSLLRTVQERKIKRVGGTKEIEVDVRIIVASNERLLEAARNGNFREDLYHRFNEFSIDVPPLRERGSDILLYANFFLEHTNGELDKDVKGFSGEVEVLFQNYPWHGNLREMRNVLKRATLLSDGNLIEMRHLPFELVNHKRLLFAEKEKLEESQPITDQPFRSVSAIQPKEINLKDAARQAEAEMILAALKEANFNKSKAARILKIDRKTLYNKMQAHKI